MTSTSLEALARDLLARCVAGDVPEELPRALAEDPDGQALFGILVEGLADRFEPAQCDAYARLLAHAMAPADPAPLVARYERVRRVRPVRGEPRRVFVLSRVTLGADVAVTSVLLAAAKERFPRAKVVLVGPRKNYELFAADPRIGHAEVAYRRGSLGERLSVREPLESLLSAADSIVLDPDSRLTQLGLLPVCPEERYRLFESRGYGGAGSRSLPQLAAGWAAETLGISGARPYVALPGESRPAASMTVSLGVGENLAKRLPDPFEEQLLALLAQRGEAICVDRGAGGEEAERVARAAKRSGAPVTFWEGPFAGFAAWIAGSRLFVGYDSAGQHVAAACGVPLITVFAGFPVPRMFERWRPVGPHCQVIRVDRPDAAATLERVRAALAGTTTR